MTAATERVFVLGATGTVGTRIVKQLLAKNVQVTIYVRNSEKASQTFAHQTGPLTIVQGDVNDLDVMKKALPGHTRMFLMLTDYQEMVSLKTNIATLAYAAGIQQIVDLSCSTFNQSARTNFISRVHEESETAILNIPGRGRAVFLRPSRFMSNVAKRCPPGFVHFVDCTEPDCPQSWISPNDIADVAAVVLTGSIEDHDDNVYELTSQVATPTELTEILSRVIGRTITYKQVSALSFFNSLKAAYATHKFSFASLYNLVTMIEVSPRVSLGISILLGREPESLETYLNSNKQDFVA